MRGQSNAHVLSICLALVVFVGGWLLLEYDGKRMLSQESTTPPTSSAPTTVPRQNNTPHPSSPTISRNAQGNAVAFTFKCERNGRVSFGDQPCASSEKMLDVTTTAKEPPRDHQRELARLKAKVAEMEADRLTRERAAIVTSNNAQASATKHQCDEIDEAIKSIDRQAREPHSPAEGDRLNAERRRLFDRRFSLGC